MHSTSIIQGATPPSRAPIRTQTAQIHLREGRRQVPSRHPIRPRALQPRATAACRARRLGKRTLRAPGRRATHSYRTHADATTAAAHPQPHLP
eukprot:8118570-Pyramimonas_sp.AAC.1